MFKNVKFSTLVIFSVVLWVGVYLVGDLKNKTMDEGAKNVYNIVLAVLAVGGLAASGITFQKYQNGDSFFND